MNHVDYCNCAECIARFGLGPRPHRPAPPAVEPTEAELEEPTEAELEALTAPSSSSSARGLALEMNDPDLERLRREQLARIERELAAETDVDDDQGDDTAR